MQNIEKELIEVAKANPTGFYQKTTYRAPDETPMLISKKWLCCRFDLIHPSGKINYPRLYRDVLTPDVIEAVGLTPEQVRRCDVKTFNRVVSVRLIKILDL